MNPFAVKTDIQKNECIGNVFFNMIQDQGAITRSKYPLK